MAFFLSPESFLRIPVIPKIPALPGIPALAEFPEIPMIPKLPGIPEFAELPLGRELATLYSTYSTSPLRYSPSG